MQILYHLSHHGSPSEISQSPKNQFCMVHLHKEPRVVKAMDTESRMAVAKGWGCRQEEMGVSV